MHPPPPGCLNPQNSPAESPPETPLHPPTPLHLQNILSSRSAPSASTYQSATGTHRTPPRGAPRPPQSARWSRQSPAAPAGGPAPLPAPQTVSAPAPPDLPSAPAPSPHTPRN